MMDVILIPGLGKNHNERIFLWLRPLWRLYGIKLHIIEIDWENGEPFASKFARLKAIANELPNLVAMVGASAGASAAVNLLADGTAPKVVTVCGALSTSFIDQVTIQKRSPAFLYALKRAETELKFHPEVAKSMLTIRPASDGIVPPEFATFAGAYDLRVKTRGHAFSIAYSLTFKIGAIKKFIK